MNTTTQHTPGPWIVSHYMDDVVVRCLFEDNEAGDVATMNDVDGSAPEAMMEANARLIAAAPDLLEACKLMYKTADLADFELDKIEAAIAKAEGRA